MLQGFARVEFPKDVAGHDLYFPFGWHGRGRVIPDAQAATRVRKRIVLRGKLIALAILMAVFITIEADSAFRSFLAAGALALAAAAVFVNPAHGLAYSAERMTRMEARHIILRKFSVRTLVLLSAMSGFWFLDEVRNGIQWNDAVPLLVSGLCFGRCLWMTRLKLREPADPEVSNKIL